MEHLKGLNEAQIAAVLTTEGPVLVLAGAGAGKTRTIAHRVAHLVKEGTPAEHILAITFTNKAAREMRERISRLLAAHGLHTGRGPSTSTFHALSATLLREFSDAAGLPKHFTIYDRADSLRAMKHAVRDVVGEDKRFDPRSVLSTISKAKGDTKQPTQFRDELGHSWYHGAVADIWQVYDRSVRAEGAVDFDDLLLVFWQLLTTHADITRTLQDRYRYIHVDEYQDTNKIQYEIVRILAGERGNVFCVGDLDQAVYGWRGATIENILEFEKGFPHATVLRLEQNYRSTGTIVEVSNDIIKKNKRRREKTLFTENPAGDKITLHCGYDERDEALRIVESVARSIGQGIPGADIAVLFRANYQSRALEDAFLASGIAYRVLGTRFFDRKEVKDLLSYVRAALNSESRADIERIINTPARGIGKVTYEKIISGKREELSRAMKEKVDEFFNVLKSIQSFSTQHTASETIAHALNVSGIALSFSAAREEDMERLENVKELVSLAATRYDVLGTPDGLLRLLEDAALATDQDELDRHKTQGASDAVTLMTVHAAKGLEFRHVHVAGLEEGLFPHERLDDARTDIEEERRLFYVALTRAKEKVHLSYAQVRTIFGQRTPRMPSQFIMDIEERFLESEEGEERRGTVVYLD